MFGLPLVDLQIDIGAGAGGEVRGEREDRLGDVFIEQEPDPCRQPQQAKPPDQPRDHVAIGRPARAGIAENQRPGDQHSPAQAEDGKKERKAQPQSKPLGQTLDHAPSSASNALICAVRSAAAKGLVMKASAPTAMPLRRSTSPPPAVIISTLMPLSAASRRINWQIS